MEHCIHLQFSIHVLGIILMVLKLKCWVQWESNQSVYAIFVHVINICGIYNIGNFVPCDFPFVWLDYGQIKEINILGIILWKGKKMSHFFYWSLKTLLLMFLWYMNLAKWKYLHCQERRICLFCVHDDSGCFVYFVMMKRQISNLNLPDVTYSTQGHGFKKRKGWGLGMVARMVTEWVSLSGIPYKWCLISAFSN